jgi:UPF0271 protein
VPTSVDLNADVGETEGDFALLGIVTSASVACGYHAGGPEQMRRAVVESARLGVVVGAHPSYPDREGFGRRGSTRSAELVAGDVREQVGAMQEIAAAEGSAVRYVKLHGALYHRAAADFEVAEAIAAVIASCGPLAVLAQPGAAMLEAAERHGLRTAAEAFCDRAYGADGHLVDRSVPGAVLVDADAAAAQAVSIAREQVVILADGRRVPVRASSLCVHGDTPGVLEHAVRVRAALEAAGVGIAPFVTGIT